MNRASSDGAVPGSGKIVSLVAAREMRERGRSKSFLISTVILVLGVAAAVVVPSVLGHDGRPVFRVEIVGRPAPVLSSTLRISAAALGGTARVSVTPSPANGQSALRAQRADIVVVPPDGLLIRGDKSSNQVHEYASLLARTIPAGRALQAAGLPANRVQAVLSPVPLPVRTLVPAKPGADTGRGLILLDTLLLYMGLATYGSWVGFGVTEEKASRVAEIMISAIKPRQLLAGKVAGIGILGFAQLTLVAGTGLLAAATSGEHLPSATLGAIALPLLLFVLGFAFYSCAFAAVGATVSRQEDVQNAIAPISLLLTVGYLISLSGLTSPDSALMRFASFVPSFALLTLPARMILGHPAPWELPVSLALIAVSAYGLIHFGARTYSGALLRFGQRVNLRHAYRSGLERRIPY